MALQLLYVTQAEAVQVYERRSDGSLTHREDFLLPGAGAINAWALSTAGGGAGRRILTLATNDQLISCAIDPLTGSLHRVSACPHAVDGDALSYLSLDRTGRWLFSVYYSGGLCAVHPVSPDGSLPPNATPTCVVKLTQGSHCIAVDADNTTVYVPEVAAINHVEGSRIQILDFDESTGALTLRGAVIPPPCAEDLTLGPAVELSTRFSEALWEDGKLIGPRNRFNSRCEPGPRHFCFSPTAQGQLYIANEQGNSVSHYRPTDGGSLEEVATVESVPATYPDPGVVDLSGPHTVGGCSHTSEIHTHPNGGTLFVSNRGYDSIACFALDPASGSILSETLTSEALTSHTPQCFDLDPAGEYLYAGGGPSRTGGPHPGLDFVPEGSTEGTLTVFRVVGHGLEQVAKTALQMGAPGWVVPVDLLGRGGKL